MVQAWESSDDGERSGKRKEMRLLMIVFNIFYSRSVQSIFLANQGANKDSHTKRLCPHVTTRVDISIT